MDRSPASVPKKSTGTNKEFLFVRSSVKLHRYRAHAAPGDPGIAIVKNETSLRKDRPRARETAWALLPDVVLRHGEAHQHTRNLFRTQPIRDFPERKCLSPEPREESHRFVSPQESRKAHTDPIANKGRQAAYSAAVARLHVSPRQLHCPSARARRR